MTNVKELIDSNTIMVGGFNTSLILMGRSSKQEINKEMVALSDTWDQIDLTDLFRTFHPKRAGYTFKCTENIIQNRSHIRLKNNSQPFQKD